MFGAAFTNMAILATYVVILGPQKRGEEISTPPLYGFLFVVGFLILLVMFFIYLRDKRNSKAKDK